MINPLSLTSSPPSTASSRNTIAFTRWCAVSGASGMGAEAIPNRRVSASALLNTRRCNCTQRADNLSMRHPKLFDGSVNQPYEPVGSELVVVQVFLRKSKLLFQVLPKWLLSLKWKSLNFRKHITEMRLDQLRLNFGH